MADSPRKQGQDAAVKLALSTIVAVKDMKIEDSRPLAEILDGIAEMAAKGILSEMSEKFSKDVLEEFKEGYFATFSEITSTARTIAAAAESADRSAPSDESQH